MNLGENLHFYYVEFPVHKQICLFQVFRSVGFVVFQCTDLGRVLLDLIHLGAVISGIIFF